MAEIKYIESTMEYQWFKNPDIPDVKLPAFGDEHYGHISQWLRDEVDDCAIVYVRFIDTPTSLPEICIIFSDKETYMGFKLRFQEYCES